MRPVTVTQTGVGTSALIPWDYIQTPFNASISTVVTGTATYTIQHTFDDIFASTYNPATGTWFDHDVANMVAATTNQDSNYSAPIRASRINLTSGTGSVALTGLQGIGH
jgi:long-subunit fatty acid transport protein